MFEARRVTSLNARDTRRKIKLHAEGTHYAAGNVTWYRASGASSNDARTGWWRSNILSFVAFLFLPLSLSLSLRVFTRVSALSLSLSLCSSLSLVSRSFTLLLPARLTPAWKIPIISKLVSTRVHWQPEIH